MVRNIIKVIILVIVSFGSLEVASEAINQLVTEVKLREETITDAIIKKQVETTFKAVEKKIEEVVKEEAIEIKTEKVEMKPPEVKKEKPKQEIVKEETIEEETVEGELVPVEVEDLLVIQEESVVEAEMTKEDMIYIGNYLVENYFLDGNVYYQSEQDPARYERKQLTHEMEGYVISSLGSLMDIVMDMKKINVETISLIIEDAMILSQEFEDKFKAVKEQGEDFGMIYEETNAYFATYLETLGKMKFSLESITKAPNPALVISIIMKDLNQVIIPGIKDVINTGFDLKDKTNAIYIEGTEGVKLLTREDVISIIKNPESIISKEEESKPNAEQGTSEIENKQEEMNKVEDEKTPIDEIPNTEETPTTEEVPNIEEESGIDERTSGVLPEYEE